MAKKKVELGGSGPTFGALAGAFSRLGFEAPADVAEPVVALPDDALKTSGALRVVIEKKGHRGKCVTVISGLEGGGLKRLVKSLRKELGCGVSLRATELLVQGEQRDRVWAALSKRGLA